MTQHMAFAGMIELMRPMCQFTKGEQERLAEQLNLVADEIRKGCDPSTARFYLDIEAEERT